VSIIIPLHCYFIVEIILVVDSLYGVLRHCHSLLGIIGTDSARFTNCCQVMSLIWLGLGPFRITVRLMLCLHLIIIFPHLVTGMCEWICVTYPTLECDVKKVKVPILVIERRGRS